jgi:PKD repeat protein
LYYRLADTSGTDAVDSGIRANTGDYVGTATRNVAGVISGNAAVQFRGAGFIASRTALYNPTNYSAEIWFNTTTALGGKLIGFGNARSGNSTTYDRHIYMQNDGKVVFGVKTGAANTVISTQSYNDGLWHHAVATQGPDGMDLYVDGRRVGSNPQKLATPFTGYWRIGGDTTGGASTNSNFVGNLDEAAVYNAVLSPSDVLANYSRGGGLLANTGPTAAFTASTSFDDLSADASASTDSDGSIVSYEWDFGDDSTGTGVTATHRYATAGTYTVTLKVTDDDGATNQTTRQITTVLNQPPTASFLRSSTSLVTTTNALASTDSDGSIVHYAWEFGDGSTGTGVTATHAYATAGTYTITLTVTDDHGATGVLSRLVTVAGAAVYASDAFERTLVNSFGTADTGGTWTNTGTAAWYSVNNGTGKHLLNIAGRTTASYLNSVSATDVSATVDLSFDKAPTGGGFYSSLAVRRIGTSEYRVRAKALPTSTSLTLSRIVSGTETTISAIALPGLTYTPGDTWRIKLEATGTGTTTLTAKLWNITQPEPLTAQLTSTDTTPSLQSPGGIGLINYIASSVTNVPITVAYNNLLVVPKN